MMDLIMMDGQHHNNIDYTMIQDIFHSSTNRV